MPWQVHLTLQICLAALQFLVPPFFALTKPQETAVASFVSAVQVILALYNHKDGPKAPDEPNGPNGPSSGSGEGGIQLHKSIGTSGVA